MSMDELNDVVAERELERPEEESARIVVRIGRPQPDPEMDWTCSYQIRGIGDEQVRTAHGIDAVQALQLCMGMIRADLGALQRSHRLTWLGEVDLGF
jgi:hypothetical protein